MRRRSRSTATTLDDRPRHPVPDGRGLVRLRPVSFLSFYIAYCVTYALRYGFGRGGQVGLGPLVSQRVIDAYLEVWGPNGPAPLPLDGEAIVVGRDEACQVAFPHDAEVSRRHAAIERLPVGWAIRDLSSSNGTFVCGQRVLSTRPLENRDEIRVGRQRLVFRAQQDRRPLPPTEAAQPPPELTRREHAVSCHSRDGSLSQWYWTATR
jgi:FHA domain